MAILILIRHGQSEWNALGKWTGITDVSITEQGKAETRLTAELLRKYHINKAYTSSLRRTHQTLQEIQQVLGLDLDVVMSPALNERDYGDLTGQNKWEIKEKHGHDQWMSWRRSWDAPVPGGETLKDVYARVVPYYQQYIQKDLKTGLNVIVASHGNTLRALMKYLENIADKDIGELEIPLGGACVYQIDTAGNVTNSEMLGGKIDLPNQQKSGK